MAKSDFRAVVCLTCKPLAVVIHPVYTEQTYRDPEDPSINITKRVTFAFIIQSLFDGPDHNPQNGQRTRPDFFFVHEKSDRVRHNSSSIKNRMKPPT